jgi:hypothetical protein
MGIEKIVDRLVWFQVHEAWLDCACWWADPSTDPDLYAVILNGC